MKALSLIIATLLSLSGCRVEHFSDGSKRTSIIPARKDKHIFTEEEIADNAFDLNLFMHPDTCQKNQLVDESDLRSIVHHNDGKFLIIFIYPNCINALETMEVAKFAEQNEIPFMLISGDYQPKRMKYLLNKYDINNRNRYIIPSIKGGEKRIKRKKMKLVMDLCSDCYEQKMDELVYTNLMIISKEDSPIINASVYGKYHTKEYLLNWIETNF